MLWIFVWLIVLIAGIYYFMFGGKEKLAMYLYNKKSIAEKVELTFKKDFSSEYADAAFYIGNNYRRRYSQREWQTYYQENIDPSLDKNSPEYLEAVAPMVNAVVIGRYGYYLRRGMEDMSKKLVKFLPGVNDDLSLNYAIEPYKYYKNKELAAKSLAEEALRQKEFEEEYERERPIREAREAERKAAQQQRYQEQRARREEQTALFERQRQERQASRAAFLRCKQCVNSGKCSMQARSNSGACGGYMPRQ